jgi:arylformamidase
MRYVDLTHPFGHDTPPWMNLPSPLITVTSRFSTNGVFSQKVETVLHTGTHIDAPIHFIPGAADMASIPLEQLIGDGVIVDISDCVGEWDVIMPEHITSKVEVRKGDIVIYHTGFHHYYTYGDHPDEEKYMCRHPGGGKELADWIVDMELKWTGVDCGSAEHPMNNLVKVLRPDLRAEYERRIGMDVETKFPPETYCCMHRVPFRKGIVHVENVGGDIDLLLNCRVKIGAFPWRFQGGEGSICRVVAFVE